MPTTFPMRGAIPTPKSELAVAARYTTKGFGAPPNAIVVPAQISFWGNYYNGDCVTAEEAFAKACQSPEILISDNEVIAWATAHGVLNGAYLNQVLQLMQTAGFQQGAETYDDGPYSLVDFTDAATLQSAISSGPVKLAVAGDQLDTTWWNAGGSASGGKSGWFALGYQKDTNYDHSVSLCGYGTIAWLAQQLKVNVPAGVDGTQPGYALFTWDSIGIIDWPSLQAITCEAWLRQPTTVIVDHPEPGQLLSYTDSGIPGNVSDPLVVGFGGWSPFKFLFAGKSAAGQDRIYAVDANGRLLSYGDAGTPGNVSDPVVVGNGGWSPFKSLFAGTNAAGQHRIYAVDTSGRLLSYGDSGTPGNVSDPVVVGNGGWSPFKFLFAGTNAAGQGRIYAVDQSGRLLSYGDSGTPGNVSDPVVVGDGGWSPFKFLFAGKNAAGQDRIYAVDASGRLLSYGDSGTPGNVSNPVVVGNGGWSSFKTLFAGTNAAGQDRIYAVVA
jgi:hypothetical protein